MSAHCNPKLASAEDTLPNITLTSIRNRVRLSYTVAARAMEITLKQSRNAMKNVDPNKTI